MTYAKIENGSVVYPPRNDGNRFNVDKDEQWLADHGFTQMTAEELANAIQSVKNLDTVKEQTYQELWSNYKTFQQKYVDAEDLTLAVMCSSGGSEKGKAVQMWVMGLWQKYYTVKDTITSAQSVAEIEAIDIHAESYGEPPYTIRELNEEASAYLKENNQG